MKLPHVLCLAWRSKWRGREGKSIARNFRYCAARTRPCQWFCGAGASRLHGNLSLDKRVIREISL